MFKTQRESQQRFSIRKYAFGATSILLGTFFAVSGQAYANEVKPVSETTTQSGNVSSQPAGSESSSVDNSSAATQSNTSTGTVSPTSEKKEDTGTPVIQPTTASGVNTTSTSGTTVTNVEVPSSDKEVKEEKPMNVFSLDAGRKYFTPAEIKETVDTVANLGFTDFHLLLGNNALRFVLDDMSLDVNGQSYASDKVKEAIKTGNKKYEEAQKYTGVDGAVLTQAEMDDIVKHVKDKKMRFIPTINSPGHMNAIVTAIGELGVSDAAFTHNGKASAGTIDLNNKQAVDITKSLVDKYAKYFSDKSEIFNIGLDEYANDSTRPKLGFKILQEKGDYGKFVTYANDLASIVKKHGMTPMAFNDGIYHANVTDQGTFDKDIIVSYWTAGFSITETDPKTKKKETAKYVVAKPQLLQEKGHKILNTNDSWYLVIGRENQSQGWYHLGMAMDGASKVPHNQLVGEEIGAVPLVGSMVAVWADEPRLEYNLAHVKNLIAAYANKNPELFNADYTEFKKVVDLIPKDLDSLPTGKAKILKKIVDSVTFDKKRSEQEEIDVATRAIKSILVDIAPKDKDVTDLLDLRIFSLDAARKYQSPEVIKQVIDKISELGYTDLHLTLGNNALRFLLDDMSININGKEHASDVVKTAIQNGNDAYHVDPNGTVLTESQMTEIIKYAEGKKIGIIPTINSPGHMNAILSAIGELGIQDVGFVNKNKVSKEALNFDNGDAVNATKAILDKYIKYFSGKVKLFNIGLDDFASDISSKYFPQGFKFLEDNKKYDKFVEYANDLTSRIKAAGMKAMAFNDGIYYNNNTSSGEFDKDLIVAYSRKGFGTFKAAKLSLIQEKGHHIINANNMWEYIVGVGTSNEYDLNKVLDRVAKTPYKQTIGEYIGMIPTIGNMVSLKVDKKLEKDFSFEELVKLATAFADKNPTYLKANYNAVIEKLKTIPADFEQGLYTEETSKLLTELINCIDWDKARSQQGDVETHLAELTKAIEALAYKKADYTKVDAVLAKKPADLTPFVAESVKVLENLLASIDRNKDIRSQAEVDAYVEKIQQAIEGLVAKPEVLTVDAKAEITIESKIPEVAPTAEEKPEITIESKVPEVAPTVEAKPEIPAEISVPKEAPTAEVKPEITIESKVPEVAPTAEEKPEITIERKVPEVAPTVEEKTALDVTLPVKKQEVNSVVIREKDVVKKTVAEKVLPKTSAETNDTDTNLPLGLATALMAVGLLTRKKKEL